MKYTDLLSYMRKLMRFLHLESKLLERTMGLSIPQLLALSYLNGQDDYRSNHRAIGEYLTLNPSTVTGIVSRLEKKGLVARVPDNRDRRTSIVILTRNGQEILHKSLSYMNEKFEAKMKDGKEEREEALVRSFEEIIRFINAKDAEVSAILDDMEGEEETTPFD